MESLTPDYIVVGAGSAGCIVAAELSQGGKNRVLVLEAGPSDRHPLVKVPLGYGLLFNDRVRNYAYSSLPEPALANRRIYIPRGKTVGGSGSINALVYFRGMPSDYERWKADGLTDWGWETARPWFEANEQHSPSETGLTVTDPVSERHPFTRTFVAASRELGLGITDDFNGCNPEGMGFYHITTRSGFRNTSADAFLRPAMRQGNAHLKTRAVVSQIELSGSRATGIVYNWRGREHTSRAHKAIIISAGAINSPQLLQLSGIGDPEHLARIGVRTCISNPNVGSRLQDHFFTGYQFRTREPTLNQDLHTFPAKARQVLKYLLTRRGPLSNSVNQFGGFIRSSPDEPVPNLQLYLNPASYTLSRNSGGPMLQTDPFPGFTLGFQPTCPTSRGSVRAASSTIEDAPDIHLNPLATQKDLRDVLAGGHFIRRLMQTTAISSVISEPLGPNPLTMSDDEILDDFRNRATTTFHPCGTCAMGTDPSTSVVGSDLKVHDIDGLHVIDASVFPSIPSGNTNAPTMMVARAAAHRILNNA